MLFNSPIYIFIFLPIVLATYFLCNHYRLVTVAKSTLVGSSLFFYGYWNPSYLLLILISILINFSLGTALTHGPLSTAHFKKSHLSRKFVLTLGICFNLGLLGYYKYTDFLIWNLNWFFPGADVAMQNLVLPLAISFFTFQQIAYLVDSYQADTLEHNFLNYCLFITFFPQLIAGPIVHHREMMPQFSRLRNLLPDWHNIARGVFIFSIGLFKKVVIADALAKVANAGFAAPESLSLIEAWVTSLSYTFQLYYDFSGYTDMAIGAALFFNIRLPFNFFSPYKAVNIQDFWRRWHMTLSRWLRDYLYIPLGGNRRGRYITYRNILITFFLGGLWHGAGWTFVVWGMLHGVALSMHRLWHGFGFRMSALSGWFLTIFFINLTWVPFRADSLSDAWLMIQAMFGRNGFVLPPLFSSIMQHLSLTLPNIEYRRLISPISGSYTSLLFLISLLAVLSFTLPNSMEVGGLSGTSKRMRFKTGWPHRLWVIFALGFSFATIFSSNVSQEFLYFNF